MGRAIALPKQPTRIISLVPSQTELLFDLGLAEQIVGVTKFCVHPADQVKDKQSIGGTKKFRFDVIDRLQPDLIIGNKEENYKEGIEQLAANYPVWLSDIHNLPEALQMIQQVGSLVGKGEQASALASEIESGFSNLPKVPRPYRTAYFIWQKPFMVAGSNTFIDDILSRLGFVNAFVDFDGRYPQITPEQIETANLDLIFLSSEPFPFAEKQKNIFQEQFPGIQIELVDGEYFSWYGSRLLSAIVYFQQLCENAQVL